MFVDWTTETILARREFAMPQGACVDSAAGLMMVGQRRNNTIECIPMNGSPSYIISRPSLANVHSIEKVSPPSFGRRYSFPFRSLCFSRSLSFLVPSFLMEITA